MDAPDHGELEVSIFGRGVGECVVIHVGSNEWMVVDSFHTESDLPVALEYFETIGVDPRSAVRLIIATHWHTDHFRGLAKLARRCRRARLVSSAVLEHS